MEDNIKMDLRMGKGWAGCIWLRIGTVADCCEHGNEGKGFLGYLNDY
jgi:hypothetical protein